MNILLIGAFGTIGQRLHAALVANHRVLAASRTRGDVRVDLTSAASIERMYQEVPPLDAVVCVAASGALDDFRTLTEAELLENMRGKLFGQVNLVLIGQRYLNTDGSFTLTSGVFADRPAKGVTGGGVISGALHSFVLSAALELPHGQRVNVVSPTMVEDSVGVFGSLFPGLKPVAMDTLVAHYLTCIEGRETGQVVRAYGD